MSNKYTTHITHSNKYIPSIGQQIKVSGRKRNAVLAGNKEDQEEAFNRYMRRQNIGAKIGLHLQYWINQAKDGEKQGVSLEVAKRQVQEWVERNRAALK